MTNAKNTDDAKKQTIGVLKEKTLHASLKNFIDPDASHQEIKVEGYFADIVKDGCIYEIQTRDFNKLRDKLEVFLKNHPVTVVYPIPHVKYLYWINDDGEISDKRKSPKIGRPLEIFAELYRIKPFLTNALLSFKIVMIDLEEYRFLNGYSADRKKGSSRHDRIPLHICEVIDIKNLTDYQRLLPDDLPSVFTTADIRTRGHISMKKAQITANVLCNLQVIEKVGKKNKSILYQKATSI